jgi:aryl-alcohol dehydrogenase-like predicted oxidoreductase
MIYNELGHTGIYVSRICFGSLTLGPLQRNLPLDEGADLLEYAISKGINFVDTADLYGTYPYLKRALNRCRDLIIATKSYAYDRTTAKTTLDRALEGIGRDYIKQQYASFC